MVLQWQSVQSSVFTTPLQAGSSTENTLQVPQATARKEQNLLHGQASKRKTAHGSSDEGTRGEALVELLVQQRQNFYGSQEGEVVLVDKLCVSLRVSMDKFAASLAWQPLRFVSIALVYPP